MKYSIYLKEVAENNLEMIFEYLKHIGDIPANATSIGEYRSQCITFAIHYTVGGLMVGGHLPVKEVNHAETS